MNRWTMSRHESPSRKSGILLVNRMRKLASRVCRGSWIWGGPKALFKGQSLSAPERPRGAETAASQKGKAGPTDGPVLSRAGFFKRPRSRPGLERQV